MASIRRSSPLVGLLLSAIVLATVNFAFVSVQPSARSSNVAMRADKETETKMPKPDLSILNKQSQAGQTYDQDKRGNMWAVMRPAVNKKTEEALPAAVYIPAVIVFTFAAIVFFAQQTGQDASFGGSIGDGSLSYGD